MAKLEQLVEQASSHLDEGEIVRAAASGAYDTTIGGHDTVRSGVLITTDRRVVFYAKKLGGFELESFPYGNISSFEHGKSMMGHHVAFFASGNKVQVKWLQPTSAADDLMEHVRAALATKQTQPESAGEPAADDVLSQLERLGALRAAGVVTEDEFAAKKAELLSRL